MVKPNAPTPTVLDEAIAVELLRLQAEIVRLEQSKAGKGQGEIAEIENQIRQRMARQSILLAPKGDASARAPLVAFTEGEKTAVHRIVTTMVSKMDSELEAIREKTSLEYHFLKNQKVQLEQAQTLLLPLGTAPSGHSPKSRPSG